MPAGSIKVVLFDLGNVLVDFDFGPAARRLSGFCGQSSSGILKAFFDSRTTGSFEKGSLSAEEFYRLMKDEMRFNLGYESFVSIWNEVFFFTPANRQVYHIASSLKEKYRIALLSNTNLLHYRYLKENFPVFDIFERQFLSFEIGSSKPEKEIYQAVIENMGVPAEDIFYTDDRDDLVRAGASCGFKSFIFKGPKKLVEDLTGQGVLLAPGREPG
ncbi:MAG: HAD family phosphatase [Candidatus Omnitrophica bacterium]|nr:HAD family phosphatase [Candidatus Omnitrophota bacterium]MDD5770887.1 HAD family phosphatase [Candidatus Omnitrophota bacterium]